MSTPSLAQLHRAVAVAEKIEKLEAELATIMGGQGGAVGNGKRKYTKRAVVAEGQAAPAKKTKMSEAGRARIIEAQKKRWAKIKKEKKAKAKSEASKAE